ncbi:hypothetical protein L5515_018505 [Caenorhabditis briggsae]|uniref:Uncharacterized protein n=1 Tax=Caenorhabditis briggsae TaxID=6238 RepID=A0AAE9FMD8_CAEBR|nr:hypothetical protein L3Y34_012647 [Caenorhabditis briggsae]UMM42832.1 hypothetical protein L5515_018505 [Caenorhabditis briggsae]
MSDQYHSDIMAHRSKYDYGGRNLCPAVIEALDKVRIVNKKRMEAEMASPLGAQSAIYVASHRQLQVLDEMIRVGSRPWNPRDLLALLNMGFFHQELYPIGMYIQKKPEKEGKQMK